MYKIEQYQQSTLLRSWIIIIVFSASILTWGMVSHHMVPDGPREWDFGQVPSTPGESRHSTLEPSLQQNRQPPLQIVPLPEAQDRPPPRLRVFASPRLSSQSGEGRP